VIAQAMQVIENRMEEDQRDAEVFVDGGANLLSYPEYSDVEKARNFLAVLDSKDMLRKVLSTPGGMELTIRIGPENDVKELSNCSILTAKYRVGTGSTGTIGIIGPTRMNYNRAISVLDFMGRALTDLLGDR